MHVIAIIAALLIMIPAALAGIVSGLAQCLSHRPDVTFVIEHVSALLAALGPFGTGLMLVLAGLCMLLAAIALVHQRGSW